MPISKIPLNALAAGSISSSSLADGAVTSAKIADGQVLTAKIENEGITSAKILNSTVAAADLADGAVTDAKLSAAAKKSANIDSIMLNSTNGSADAGDFLVLDGTDNSSTNANDRILYDETFNPATFNIGTGTAGQAITVATNGGLEFATVSGTNVIEMLSSPCNGTQVTVPSGNYTMADVTAVQSMTTSYADLTGSSISYTPPTGTTRVIYRFYFHMGYDSTYGALHTRFYIDSDEVTDARETHYGYTLAVKNQFEYTINCNASSGSTAQGDLTSWTSAKTLKIQAREYNSGNTAVCHSLKLWDGAADTTTVSVPSLTIIALKDS